MQKILLKCQLTQHMEKDRGRSWKKDVLILAHENFIFKLIFYPRFSSFSVVITSIYL